jgi:AcrR family transcriptional regulator
MSGVKGQSPRRRYESAVRQESARRTREAIVNSASELFVARGYAATSLADIATAAGVARPTVFAAFGSKSALLGRALDQALAGDDGPVPVADRPWFQPVWDAPTQAGVLVAYARVCTLIGGRAAPLFETVRRAADASADVTGLWKNLQHNRRAGAQMVVRRLESLGPLQPALGTSRATDLLWIFNDPAHYNALVLQCGWPERAYTEWLSREMRNALLAPGGTDWPTAPTPDAADHAEPARGAIPRHGPMPESSAESA